MVDKAEEFSNAMSAFGQLSFGRQLFLFLGIAGSIALGVSVVLWSQEPEMRPLFSNMADTDASSVLDVLQKSGIKFSIDEKSNSLLVPADKIYDVRLMLAKEGMPNGTGEGFELLDKKQSFGTSQFIEQAKYLRAVEGELSRTISSFKAIRNARVHLAVQKQSVFIQEKRSNSASVFLDVRPGFIVDKETVSAIVNLVGSSIPDMDPEKVTVVDQTGRLLTDAQGSDAVANADREFSYAQELENSYSNKIESLLEPVVGVGRVKAKVTAEIDFTRLEQSRETYNPDTASVRSEQVVEEKRGDGTGVGGVPGSLSNQPAAPASASGDKSVTQSSVSNASDVRSQSVKNYELDKTISHTSQPIGRLQRLTVAVLVDDFVKGAAKGKGKKTPRTPEEIAQMTSLVKEAIGFDPQRGDRVVVINKSFSEPEPIEELPAPTIWENPKIWDIAKQVIGAVAVLILIFGVLRPFMFFFAKKGAKLAEIQAQIQVMEMNAANPVKKEEVPGLTSYEDRMRTVRQLASEDPKRVAQVVKGWMDKES